MKALYKPAARPGFEFTDRPEPRAGPGEVKIRVLRTGICGTDLHIESWDALGRRRCRRAARSPGTSSAARSSRSAPGCATCAVGDLVSGEGHIVCGTCRNCRAGRRHLCIRTSSVGRQPRRRVRRVRRAARVATSGCTTTAVDPDLGAIFDPFGNAVHTALSFPLVGEDVLITGAGPIGLMAAAVAPARRRALRRDHRRQRADRLELARQMGVDLALNVTARARSPTRQQRLGMVEGFDVALEMSGHPSALPDMIANLNHGGRIAMLGLPSAPIEIDWAKVVTHMITIKGIYGREMFETWYAMSAMLRSGLDISAVITDRFPATDWAEAFATARGGQVRQGRPRLDGGLMYGIGAGRAARRRSTRSATAGLYKHERATGIAAVGARSSRAAGEVLNFCANNYLGLADHPRDRRGGQDGARTTGASAWPPCASSAARRPSTRSSSAGCRQFLGTEATILYSSCFDANGGVFEVLLDERDAVISDELNHASIIDGIRLCKAQRLRYRNRDMADLETQLRGGVRRAAPADRHRRRLLDGRLPRPARRDLRPGRALRRAGDGRRLARGRLRRADRRGTPELFGVQDRVDIVTGTLGKALGGASGGYVSARAEIVELLRQRSRPVPVLQRRRAGGRRRVARRARPRGGRRRAAGRRCGATRSCSAAG